MKRVISTTLAALAGLLLVPSLAAAGDFQSLRGSNPLDAPEQSPERVKIVEEKGGFERGFDKQPPLIPHEIDKDEINLKTNTCLAKCHSEKMFEKKKAPKVGDSHYFDRDGNKLDEVSSRRWFCSQCHAPMTDAKPLVDNTFVGVVTKK